VLFPDQLCDRLSFRAVKARRRHVGASATPACDCPGPRKAGKVLKVPGVDTSVDIRVDVAVDVAGRLGVS
jgi:hypothetical protein